VYHCIREIALTNGHILHKRDKGDSCVDAAKFRKQVVDGLLTEYVPTASIPRGNSCNSQANLFLKGSMNDIFQLHTRKRSTNQTVKYVVTEVKGKVVTNATHIASSATCRCMLLDVSNDFTC